MRNRCNLTAIDQWVSTIFKRCVSTAANKHVVLLYIRRHNDKRQISVHVCQRVQHKTRVDVSRVSCLVWMNVDVWLKHKDINAMMAFCRVVGVEHRAQRVLHRNKMKIHACNTEWIRASQTERATRGICVQQLYSNCGWDGWWMDGSGGWVMRAHRIGEWFVYGISLRRYIAERRASFKCCAYCDKYDMSKHYKHSKHRLLCR